MPQAVALLAFQIGASVAATNAVLAASSALINVGLSLAVSAVFAPKQPQQPKPEDVQASIRANISPRIRYYGRAIASGNWLFGQSREGTLHKVLAIAHGEIDAVERFFIDDREVALDGSGRSIDGTTVGTNVVIQIRRGTLNQTAFAPLVAAFPEYTEDHRGLGMAMLYAQMEPVEQDEYSTVYPKMAETLFQWVFRGSKVRHPTTGAVAWSDNPSSILLDYLTHPDGLRMPRAPFETPQAKAGLLAAFDECNDEIAVKAGGTEPRYRLWGPYTLAERPADVIGRMLTACDGRLFPTADGGLTLDIGNWSEPSVVLDEDAITGWSDIARGHDVLETANTIRATYTEPGAPDWNGDADPWMDAEDVLANGEIASEINLAMVPSHSQTRRLMQLAYFRANPAWKGQLSLNMRGLAALGERLVRIRIEALDLDTVCEVLDFRFDIGEDGILRGATLDFAALPQEAYEWTTEKEGFAPIATVVAEGGVLPIPEGLAVEIDRLDGPTGVTPIGILTHTAYSKPGLTARGRYRKVGNTNWTFVSFESQSTRAETGVLSDASNHEFQVQFRTLTGRQGNWSASVFKTT